MHAFFDAPPSSSNLAPPNVGLFPSATPHATFQLFDHFNQSINFMQPMSPPSSIYHQQPATVVHPAATIPSQSQPLVNSLNPTTTVNPTPINPTNIHTPNHSAAPPTYTTSAPTSAQQFNPAAVPSIPPARTDYFPSQSQSHSQQQQHHQQFQSQTALPAPTTSSTLSPSHPTSNLYANPSNLSSSHSIAPVTSSAHANAKPTVPSSNPNSDAHHHGQATLPTGNSTHALHAPMNGMRTHSTPTSKNESVQSSSPQLSKPTLPTVPSAASHTPSMATTTSALSTSQSTPYQSTFSVPPSSFTSTPSSAPSNASVPTINPAADATQSSTSTSVKSFPIHGAQTTLSSLQFNAHQPTPTQPPSQPIAQTSAPPSSSQSVAPVPSASMATTSITPSHGHSPLKPQPAAPTTFVSPQFNPHQHPSSTSLSHTSMTAPGVQASLPIATPSHASIPLSTPAATTNSTAPMPTLNASLSQAQLHAPSHTASSVPPLQQQQQQHDRTPNLSTLSTPDQPLSSAAVGVPTSTSNSQVPVATVAKNSFNSLSVALVSAPAATISPTPSVESSASSAVHPVSSSSSTGVPSPSSSSVSSTVTPARSISPGRKQQLLARAHSLYDAHHRHTRTLTHQLSDLRHQLIQAKFHQASQVQLVVGAPSSPPTSYSTEPEVSPIAREIVDSADPHLLALLDNSRAIEDVLMRKRTSHAEQLTMIQRIDQFVRDQVDQERRRVEEEHQRQRRQTSDQSTSHRHRTHVDEELADVAQRFKLPDFLLPSHHPVVQSLQAHIRQLHEQNRLTSSLLLLKNRALQDQQESSHILQASLRDQIESLTRKMERRERESREEREMLVANLKDMVQLLATENEELKQREKHRTHATPPSPPPPTSTLPPSASMIGATNASHANGFPQVTVTSPTAATATPSATSMSSNAPSVQSLSPVMGNNFVPSARPPPLIIQPTPSPSPSMGLPSLPANLSSLTNMPMPVPMPMPMPISSMHPTSSGVAVPPPFLHSPASNGNGMQSATKPPPPILDQRTQALLASSPFKDRPKFLAPVGQ